MGLLELTAQVELAPGGGAVLAGVCMATGKLMGRIFVFPTGVVVTASGLHSRDSSALEFAFAFKKY